MLQKTTLTLTTALTLFISATGKSQAQDAALIDILVKKGVITTKEAEAVRADLTRDAANTSVGKINLSHSVTELKLYGDLRTRFQYDNKDGQLDPFPVGVHQDGDEKDRSPTGAQRSRWRLRLRLDAEFRLTENFSGGVELQTNNSSKSGNQTLENGFDDYGIFISRAYLRWTPAESIAVTAGKFANPFYTTDLVWDPDINPSGLAESIAFHKIYAAGATADGGYSKDGKTVSAPAVHKDGPWELTLVAGQFLFDDNDEGGGKDPGLTDHDKTTDAYLFETQLIGSYKFGNGVKVTLAPAWLFYTAGSVSGLASSNVFQDTALVSGATRNLNIIQAPGEIAFKLGGLKARAYWDAAYNVEGRQRTEDIYRLVRQTHLPGDSNDFQSNHRREDDYAYLVGIQLGENKKSGDWSVLANWRQTGVAAVDPNLNDDDFALGELNSRGFKVSAAYNFTDFAVGSISYFNAWNLRQDLAGGQATGDNSIADANAVQVLMLDFSVKF